MRVELKKCYQSLWIKNTTYNDAEHGFIRCYAVTPANINNNTICADFSYSVKHFKDLLSLGKPKNKETSEWIKKSPS